MTVVLAVVMVPGGKPSAYLLPDQTREQYEKDCRDDGGDDKILHFERVEDSNLEGLRMIMADNASLCDAVEGLLLKAYLAGYEKRRQEEKDFFGPS